MSKYLLGAFLMMGLLLVSCRTDFSFTPSVGQLRFSKTTVYLDTVFSQIGSSTYRLRVYNTSNDDISIPLIALGKGNDSKFRLMVDGLTGEDINNDGLGDGKTFRNVEVLAKDSLYVMVEVTARITDANPTDFLYTDQIQFGTDTDYQKVDLVTLIQDAYFIYPKRITSTTYEGISLGLDDEGKNKIYYGSPLDPADPVNGDELHWTAGKPYVIYGYAQVPDGKTLVVDPGARVHFHADAGLIVAKNGHIKVNGEAPPANDPKDLTKEVIFQGDRLETDFADVPGQWGTVMMLSQESDNILHHLTIKNATVGLLIQNYATITDPGIPKVTLKNVQIYQSTNVGILARKAAVTGTNVVVGDAGQSSLACTMGGSYRFEQSTFNNTWPSSKQVALTLNNYLQISSTEIKPFDLTQASFTNCIFYGNNSQEVYLSKAEANAFTFNFDHCLFKFYSYTPVFPPMYIFLADNNTFGNLTNLNPRFKNTKNHPFQIDSNSGAIGKGVVLPNTTADILNRNRNNPPDLGAYSYLP
ncbi:MAG: hypothetical protein CFE24_07355 [Flavobacterium sp. BFFFF2]|nr:MAG: hypothetical protein CFE24_07355 [Flavobacterium sp. BFFFF2]